MNLLTLRQRVWDIIETDDDEFPSSLLDAFAVDGFNRVVSSERRWPSWQSSATVTVSASTASVVIGGPQFSSALREVTSLIDVADKTRLYQRPYRDALEEYGDDTGVPEAWSVWGGSIYLWPIPDSQVVLKAVGYRAPTDWSADPSAEFDCDDLFHMAILYFVLSRCYARLEDTEISSFYEGMFVSGVQTAVATVMNRNVSDEAVILHGGGKRMMLDRPDLTYGF